MSNEQDSSSLDLHTALKEAFAEADAREKAEQQAIAQVLEPEAKGQEVPEAKGGAQETASAEADKAPAVESPTGTIEPPAHWSDEHKELFRRQSPEAQQFVLERHKAMEGDYTRKSQEIAEQRKQYETLIRTIEPFKETLASHGVTEQQAITALFQAQSMLDRDPVGGIVRLAQSYGVSPDSLARALGIAPKAESTAFVDPEVESLKERLARFEREAAAREQRAQLEKRSALEQTIREFAEAKDSKGELSHPHFDKVRGAVGALLQAGAARDLEDAYQQAVYANTELRSELLKREREAAEAKAKAELAKAAEEAKKKAIPTGKGATSVSEKEPKTLREQLQAEYRARMTGTRI